LLGQSQGNSRSRSGAGWNTVSRRVHPRQVELHEPRIPCHEQVVDARSGGERKRRPHPEVLSFGLYAVDADRLREDALGLDHLPEDAARHVARELAEAEGGIQQR
jgi:hypothetical protein